MLKLERQVRSNRIGQTAGFLDAGDRGQDFRRNFLVELDVLVKLRDHRTAQGFDFMINARFGCNRLDNSDEHLVARLN